MWWDCLHVYPHTHTFNGPLSGTTQVSRYQKGKTNLDFTEARDSEWQWHPLGHMQICISLQSDNHASTPPLSFLQAGCPSCRPTNSVKALKAWMYNHWLQIYQGIFQWNKFLNRLRFDRIMVMSLWPPFFGPPGTFHTFRGLRVTFVRHTSRR